MAGEAPIPTGQSGEAEGAADAAGAKPEVKMFNQQQVEAIVASRLRNSKRSEADLKAKLADLERKVSEFATTADDDDDEPPALTPTTTATTAKPEKDDRWKRRAEKLRTDFETERKDMLAKLEAADKAHNETRIEHSLMAELSKRGNVRDVQSVMKLTGSEFDVVDGQVVPKGEDATTVSEFYDKWLVSHQVFVTAPPAGGGERPGRLATPGKKRVADMSEAEAHHHAVGKLFGVKR